MNNIPRLILLLILLTVMLMAGNTGITSTDFLDLEDSSDNALVTINNWYDLAWYWRKLITINNGGGTLTEYQIKVTVNTQELILASKMQPDGDDIRFTQSDGISEIPYWIESGIDTTSTIVWVKMPSIPSGDSAIYMYYRNPDASTASSMSNTFPNGSFQDLFADISEVDTEGSSSMTVTSGEAQLLVADTQLADVIQNSQSTSYSLYGDRWHGQTFYANLSGYLTRITIRTRKVGSPPNTLEVQLRNATGGDEPGSTIYATASRSDIGGTLADYEFSFKVTANATAGAKYSIVIKTSGGDSSNYYQLRYQNTDVYFGGRRLTSTDGGQSWTVTTTDLYFETYITTTAVLDQSQIAGNTNGQVYSNNWEGQSFVAGASGNLTAVIINASAMGSPPNDLTVEVQNAEEYIEEVIDQSQTSYSGNRLVYSGNWSAQTFRAGYSSDLSKVTLRAAKTDSPPNALTVQLRNVTTGSQQNVDQSQTSYTGDRQIYTNNWVAQIFQAGLSDNLTKVSLRAAKTGNPSGNLTVELHNALQGAEQNLDQSQTANDGATNAYSNTWAAQTFQAGLTGDLTKVNLRLVRNENQDQSQTSYSGDRQVYGNSWWVQIFQPGASGNLGEVFLRTAKTGSPPNALAIELRNAVTNYQETQDQSQISYTGDRQIYGDNWSAQTFYAGVSGNMTKVTLRAAKTGSPPANLTVELRDISGGETLDQIQTQQNAARNVYGSQYAGQTFTANITGTLTKVTLRLLKTGAPPDPIVVEIRDSVSDLPGTTIYATANKSANDITTSWTDYDFIFDSPASVSASTQYAIVIYTTNGDASNYFRVRHQNTDVYAGGRRVQSNNGGSSWTGSAQDTYFTTYVNPGALPGTTVYATASRGDITMAGEYDFVYSTPYSVNSGTQYTLVIYTSGGDASNYYSISYQNSNAYGLGRECYSGNSGTSWTGSDSTDLYFKTYINVVIGVLPGSTVHATTSSSNITTAGEYGFIYSSPYSVTAGTQYALVIYTSGGDSSNYYSISYQNANTYANGRECSSSNGGTDWSGSDSTDLYFRTVIGNPLGAIEVQIRNSTVGDLPGNTIYASVSKEPGEIGTSLANYDFTFTSPASVTAGVKYAIVVKATGGDTNNRYRWRHQSADVYASGRRCTSADGGSSWTGTTTDFYFETYVDTSAYIPGSTVYATTSRGDITTAGEYDFTYTSPYSVSAGTRYAIVIYTSGGDASNYYNISYQNSDAYSNGRECSSSNGGTDWTGSDSTDLYFRTYITTLLGDTPGTTVYASTSRSDITTAGEYDFVFASPYSITAETNYAVVIYTSGGDSSNYYSVSYQGSNAYNLGKECASTDSGSSWVPNSSADLYFKTYVRMATGKYVPGGTVYASASRSNIGSSVQAHIFFFSSPATIASGTRYALVIKTAGGDASNYYSVSYQNVNVYANGERSYSSNGGTDWTPTDYDLYFKMYAEYGRTISASGIIRSATIPIDNATRFAVGIQLSWNDTEQTNSDIKYQLEYYTGSTWSLIPDGDLPSNSVGFDDSPADISSVLTDYGQIRLRANLSSTYSTNIPGIQDWTVTYYYRKYAAPEPGVAGLGTEE